MKNLKNKHKHQPVIMEYSSPKRQIYAYKGRYARIKFLEEIMKNSMDTKTKKCQPVKPKISTSEVN